MNIVQRQYLPGTRTPSNRAVSSCRHARTFHGTKTSGLQYVGSHLQDLIPSAGIRSHPPNLNNGTANAGQWRTESLVYIGPDRYDIFYATLYSTTIATVCHASSNNPTRFKSLVLRTALDLNPRSANLLASSSQTRTRVRALCSGQSDYMYKRSHMRLSRLSRLSLERRGESPLTSDGPRSLHLR